MRNVSLSWFHSFHLCLCLHQWEEIPEKASTWTLNTFILSALFTPSFMANAVYFNCRIVSFEPVFICLNLCQVFRKWTGDVAALFNTLSCSMESKWKCECESGVMAHHLLKTRVVWPFSPPVCLCLSVSSERTVFLIRQGNSYCAADLSKPPGCTSGFRSDLGDFGSSCLPHLCEVVFACRCGTRQTDTWTSQDYIFEFKVQPWTGPLYSFLLLIRAQKAFLGCESEDKGHWVISKLTLDPLWFRGFSHVCTHICKDTQCTTNLPE